MIPATHPAATTISLVMSTLHLDTASRLAEACLQREGVQCDRGPTGHHVHPVGPPMSGKASCRG